MQSPDDEWLSLAERASNEMDPKKLEELIDQLCAAIDRRRGKFSQRAPGKQELKRA
jgi:hypothetical protein